MKQLCTAKFNGTYYDIETHMQPKCEIYSYIAPSYDVTSIIGKRVILLYIDKEETLDFDLGNLKQSSAPSFEKK